MKSASRVLQSVRLYSMLWLFSRNKAEMSPQSMTNSFHHQRINAGALVASICIHYWIVLLNLLLAINAMDLLFITLAEIYL